MGQDRLNVRIVVVTIVFALVVSACGARSGEGLLEAAETTSSTTSTTASNDSSTSTGPSPSGPSTLQPTTSSSEPDTSTSSSGSSSTTAKSATTTTAKSSSTSGTSGTQPTTAPTTAPTTSATSSTTAATTTTTAATTTTTAVTATDEATTTLGVQRIQITPEFGAKVTITGDHTLTSSAEFSNIQFTAPDTGATVVTNSNGSDLCFDEGSGDVNVSGSSIDIGRSCTITVSAPGNASYLPAVYQVTVQLVAAFHLSYSVSGAAFTGCYQPGATIPTITVTGDRVDEIDLDLVGTYVFDGFGDRGTNRQVINATISPTTPTPTTVTATLNFRYPGVILFTADPSPTYTWNIQDVCP